MMTNTFALGLVVLAFVAGALVMNPNTADALAPWANEMLNRIGLLEETDTKLLESIQDEAKIRAETDAQSQLLLDQYDERISLLESLHDLGPGPQPQPEPTLLNSYAITLDSPMICSQGTLELPISTFNADFLTTPDGYLEIATSFTTAHLTGILSTDNSFSADTSFPLGGISTTGQLSQDLQSVTGHLDGNYEDPDLQISCDVNSSYSGIVIP